MHHAWTKGLKGDKKEERVAQVTAYKTAFDDLGEVIRATLKKRESDRNYNEGWANRQIAANEYNAALEDILRIIDLNHKRK